MIVESILYVPTEYADSPTEGLKEIFEAEHHDDKDFFINRENYLIDDPFASSSNRNALATFIEQESDSHNSFVLHFSVPVVAKPTYAEDGSITAWHQIIGFSWRKAFCGDNIPELFEAAISWADKAREIEFKRIKEEESA